MTPFFDFFVMAGEEDFGNLEALEFLGSCVMRVFFFAVEGFGEGILFVGAVFAEDAGD